MRRILISLTLSGGAIKEGRVGEGGEDGGRMGGRERGEGGGHGRRGVISCKTYVVISRKTYVAFESY